MYSNVLILIFTGKAIPSTICAKQNYSDFIFTLSKNLEGEKIQYRYKNTDSYTSMLNRQQAKLILK